MPGPSLQHLPFDPFGSLGGRAIYLFLFFFWRLVLGLFLGSWFYAFLLLCFSASLLLCFSCFSACLLLCFSASLLLCFSVFCFSFFFSCFLLFLLLCFTCFFSSLLYLLLFFSASLLSLLLCFSDFVLLCLSTSTILLFLFFSLVFRCSTSFSFASLLPVFTTSLCCFLVFCFSLPCLYPKCNTKDPR